MKEIALLVYTFFIFLSAQAQTIIKSFSEQDMKMAVATCVKPTSDGGFAIGGFISDTAPAYHCTGFLMKLDSSYNVIFGKRYDTGKPYDHIFEIDIASDSGFLLIGDYTANLFDPFGFSIIKTDPNGNLLWEKIYPGFNLYTYCKTSDKGFLLGGITTGPGHSLMDMTKVDSAFNLQWSYAYTSSDSAAEDAASVKETPDHGFIVVGGSSNINGNPYNALYLLKTDSVGMPEWAQRYHGPYINNADDIVLDSDSGFTLGGLASRIIDTLGNWNELELVMKTDKAGNFLWGNLYNVVGGSINHIEKGPDNGYYIYDEFIISKTDSLGNLEWTKSLFPNAYDRYFAYYQPDTNDLLLCGATGGRENESVFILKTTSQIDSCTSLLNNIKSYPYNPTVDSLVFTVTLQYGQDTVVSVSSDLIFKDSILCSNDFTTSVRDIDNVNKQNQLVVYPNPASNQLTIHGSQFTTEKIEIYNVLGVCCLKSEIENPKSEMTMDVSNLSSGVYFVRVSDETQSFVSKFVKE